MKILYVDTFADGHHVAYINGLLKNTDANIVLALPEKITIPTEHKQIVVAYDAKKRSIQYDISWLNRIYNVAEQENPDIVHFLYGDILYRSLGAGLNKFKKYKTIVTFHVIKNDFKHRIGMRIIAKKVDQCVVHTQALFEQTMSWNISNAVQIEYPCFFPENIHSVDNLRKQYKISKESTVFLAIGATREYKGLNYLLEALKNVRGDFHLVIAGAEEFYTKKYIEDCIVNYSNRVTLILHQLSDEEFMDCLTLSDWIVLPYKKSFSGASGPLAEGVVYGKNIIGVDTGSIGRLIREHNLGYTFEAENICALSEVLSKALAAQWIKDERYKKYQQSLNPNAFLRKYQELYRRLVIDYTDK